MTTHRPQTGLSLSDAMVDSMATSMVLTAESRSLSTGTTSAALTLRSDCVAARDTSSSRP
eukprot:CAMPEP_0206046266 /NCGR_PEP_ID=MMETSP1466-20131121/18166_1 /ASSEMBLY_ACC=CAM_ASM_001126 /TAXON_ID=44452 /ORGANISM="Pavlova gyrans, Strain CCMP608" /LENGTH=59 /DNA_ID=CAMNT_0053421241 /DNA_START=15 /DNA_END=190 /DNA_ORIENTATION=-